jgi:hypothetical protein
MTQPSDVALPRALNPGRAWVRNFRNQDTYFSLVRLREEGNDMPDIMVHIRWSRLTRSWAMRYNFSRIEEVTVESTDPPFQLAEALYDAAKWT